MNSVKETFRLTMLHFNRVNASKWKESLLFKYFCFFLLLIFRDMNILRTKNSHRIIILFWQADVDVVFSFSNLNLAQQLDHTADTVAENICSQKGGTIPGGIGPFGLLTLASQNLEEYTAIFFTIFKTNNNTHKVVFCADARRFVYCIFLGILTLG